jgi:amino acid adenylation domain-containing protein
LEPHNSGEAQVIREAFVFPLSFAQQRLWFVEQLEPGTGVYNLPAAYRLRGCLSVRALEQSLNEIISRHEVLRTSFSVSEGQPVQVIAPGLKVKVETVDLRDVSPSTREAEAVRFITDESRRAFDLTQAPLLRASVLRLAEQEHILLLVMHHIISDGWSMGVFFRELAALYEAFLEEKPSPLADLSIQYADFSTWQREWMQGETLEAELSYWKPQLRGIPPLLQLPSDRPRPPVQTYAGAERPVVLSQELSGMLYALSRREGLTPFMVLLAVFQVLLYRYTGQENIVVGAPIANRNQLELEGLIGFFANTLALCGDLSGNPSFLELLSQIREVCLGAYGHQDLPFEKLVEVLEPDRDLSHNPIFQVMLVLRQKTEPGFELSGLTSAPMRIDRGSSKFDLTLDLVEGDQELSGALVYNTDLFDEATIIRLWDHFQMLLNAVTANPRQRLAEIPILTQGERRQLLVEWNDTKEEYPERCVHELFEEQAERSPEGVAVIYEDKQLTYRELNQQANQLAYYLQECGVGPEVLVCICMERSLDMVVSVLAILKAGGCCAPLDPAFPRERLAIVLEDARAQVLLTETRFVTELIEDGKSETGDSALQSSLLGSRIKVICLDTERNLIARQDEAGPVRSVSADNLVYVIYTSGSTGRPKAVALPHRALSNLIAWQLHQLGRQEAITTLQFASLSFDVSFQEIFTTWCAGGTLVMVPESLRRDSNILARFITDKNINTLFLPFVQLQQLTEAMISENQLSLSLRQVITAGEQLHITQSIVGVFDRLRDCPLYNQYGPSESHVVTEFALKGPAKDWPALPPIGRPVANSQIYLLDHHLQPVPTGVTGELYIGGCGLARGYLHRPELTAEKFIPHPFSSEAGQRLYKTGDLARYLADGNIEFLGRIDHQVKIRGFRIELGEIEAALAQHPTVREAVVSVQGEAPGDRRLVAYVTLERTLGIIELRNFLKTKLPDYMVPSAFVFLDRLPVTANGKVDRGALPDPGRSRPELENPFVSPSTPIEKTIASIWVEVFKLERIGIHDNFFDLGGHSLMATQVISRLREAFETELPLRLLFEHPTIHGVALYVENQGFSGKKTGASPTSIAHIRHTRNETVSPLAQIERRPLLSLVVAGKIPPVDAAALSYFANQILENSSVTRDEVIHDWCGDLPLFNGILDTSFGRIAVILLPRFRNELYESQDDLVNEILEALEIAATIGARAVSLTGLIPWATDNGRAVERVVKGRQDLPLFAKTHATTAAAVVLTLKRMLQEGGRNLANEDVGFLGMSLIGLQALRLMLKFLPHPKTLMVCNPYGQSDETQPLIDQIMKQTEFRGPFEVVQSRGKVPRKIYDASVIVGATDVPNLLDVIAVKPGAMVVDISASRCFKPDDAIRRFEDRKDILFSEGGSLQLPSPIRRIRYLPHHMEEVSDLPPVEALTNRNPSQIGSCALSSLLSTRFEDLGPVADMDDDSCCAMHFRLLTQLKCQAADLHCGDFVLPEQKIQYFRQRFGSI